MKKILAVILAAVLCLPMTLGMADENETIARAAAELEILSKDKGYLEAVGASDEVQTIITDLASPHGEQKDEWRIVPDMDYLLSLIDSSDVSMSDEGKNQVIRRTFSGIANLLSARVGIDQLTACSYMTLSEAGEKTQENCVRLFTYESGSPLLVSQWNSEDYCYFTVSLIPEDALTGGEDEEAMQKLFSEFFPKCSVEKIK